MISKFTGHVNAIIGSKSAELEAKFYKYQDKIKEIEKKLDSEKIKTRKDAIAELRKIFGTYISDDEYRRIDSHAKYDIR